MCLYLILKFGCWDKQRDSIIFVCIFISFIAKQLSIFNNCCIFQPVFGCCAPKTLVEICDFNIFNSKKLKKAKNLQQNFAKKHVFLSWHQNAGQNIQQIMLCYNCRHQLQLFTRTKCKKLIGTLLKYCILDKQWWLICVVTLQSVISWMVTEVITMYVI